jgi:hypothetical protein
MIRIPAILSVLLSIGHAQTQWKQVETVHFDWGGPGQAATFVLERPLQSDGPGDFTRLRIRTPGHHEFVLNDEEGLVNFRKENCSFPFAFCKRKNLVNSDYLLFLPVSEGRSALFVFGWAYASSPGSLHVIELNTDGTPYESLSKKEFDLYDLKDVDADGIPEIVGKDCMSQSWGGEGGNALSTYDPYSVYRLGKSQSGKTTYSLELSRQYNLKHYYGWAGPSCSEEYAVVLHPPGRKRPIIMKSKEAEKLFEKK